MSQLVLANCIGFGDPQELLVGEQFTSQLPGGLSPNIGKIVKLEEFQFCFIITDEIAEGDGVNVTIEDIYDNCPDCITFFYTLNDCCTNLPIEWPAGAGFDGVIYLEFTGCDPFIPGIPCPNTLLPLIITEINSELIDNPIIGCLKLTRILQSEIPETAEIIPYENLIEGVTTVPECEDCQVCNDALPPTTGDCGSLNCPPGSELIEGNCTVVETFPVFLNPIQYTVEAGFRSSEYCQFGMRIYENVDAYTFPLTDAGSQALLYDANNIPVSVNPSSPVSNIVWDSQGTTTRGRLNIAGIWTDQCAGPIGLEVCPPINEWIGFSTCVTVLETKVYCIGLAADNKMRFKINGQLIAQFTTSSNDKHHKYWHIIPITLQAGANIIEMEGLNELFIAAFAAEIYDATPQELIDVTTQVQLENDYLIWSTKDRVGQDYDIGENSGYTCPDGSSYNSCTGGDCISTSIVPLEVIQCCLLIENCKNTEETYLIKMDDNAEDIYLDTVYTFGNNPIFLNKCFKVIDRVLCPEADYENLIVVTNHGLDNCLACENAIKLESCTTPGIFEYISLASEQPALIPNNVYEFDAITGCYTFIEILNEFIPNYENVSVTVDHNTSYCLICEPCHLFRNCVTDEELRVRFANNVTVPSIDFVYNISGTPEGETLPIEDICWKYIGPTTCDEGTENAFDVTIVRDFECDDCSICNPKYLLTDCVDPNNTIIVAWDQNEDPLNELSTYVFTIDEETCFNIVARPPQPCGIEEAEMTLSIANVIAVYDDCAECNKVCYRFKDCVTDLITHYSEDPSWATYLNKIIKWTTQTIIDSEDPITYTCSKVESYICRSIAYDTFIPGDIVIEDCYRDCTSCLAEVPVVPEEPTKLGRPVDPGYSVPSCKTCEDE
jgi:hypothetical protein